MRTQSEEIRKEGLIWKRDKKRGLNPKRDKKEG